MTSQALPHQSEKVMMDCELSTDSSVEALRAAITEHLVSAVKTAEGGDSPFSHIYIRNLFPPSIYDWILANPPDFELLGDSYHRDSQKPDGSSTRKEIVFSTQILERLPAEPSPVWQAIYQSLQSDTLREILAERLATDLTKRFEIPSSQLAQLDCKPRTMFIRDLAGYRITPHRDIRRKHITMQIYLPKDESQLSLGTTIYRELWGSNVVYWIKRLARILPRAWRHRLYLREVQTFPFFPNSGYAFAVSEASWHGRSALPPHPTTRDSLMHIYYERDAKEVRDLD